MFKSPLFIVILTFTGLNAISLNSDCGCPYQNDLKACNKYCTFLNVGCEKCLSYNKLSDRYICNAACQKSSNITDGFKDIFSVFNSMNEMMNNIFRSSLTSSVAKKTDDKGSENDLDGVFKDMFEGMDSSFHHENNNEHQHSKDTINKKAESGTKISSYNIAFPPFLRNMLPSFLQPSPLMPDEIKTPIYIKDQLVDNGIEEKENSNVDDKSSVKELHGNHFFGQDGHDSYHRSKLNNNGDNIIKPPKHYSFRFIYYLSPWKKNMNETATREGGYKLDNSPFAKILKPQQETGLLLQGAPLMFENEKTLKKATANNNTKDIFSWLFGNTPLSSTIIKDKPKLEKKEAEKAKLDSAIIQNIFPFDHFKENGEPSPQHTLNAFDVKEFKPVNEDNFYSEMDHLDHWFNADAVEHSTDTKKAFKNCLNKMINNFERIPNWLILSACVLVFVMVFGYLSFNLIFLNSFEKQKKDKMKLILNEENGYFQQPILVSCPDELKKHPDDYSEEKKKPFDITV